MLGAFIVIFSPVKVNLFQYVVVVLARSTADVCRSTNITDLLQREHPKFWHKVTHPMLNWASQIFDGKLPPNGYCKDSAMVTMGSV